jgi:hypothetical protein
VSPELESILLGLFLSVYVGLTAEGAACTRQCLAAFAADTEAYPAELAFFRFALEETAKQAIDESLRAHAQLH